MKRGWQDYQWSIVGAIGITGLVLGYIGFWKYFQSVGEHHSVLDIVYSVIQLFPLQSGFVSGYVPWELEVARLLTPGVAVYTGGKALAAIFHEQLQLICAGLMKDHVVICGLGQKGLLLAKAFHDAGHRVVVIDHEKENSKLDQCTEDGAIVLVGNATDRTMLRKARVQNARHLISVCGDDGINGEVAMQARDLVRQRKGRRLECHIHISDFQLSRLLTEKLLITEDEGCFRLHYFNAFESGARALLASYPPFPLEGKVNGGRGIVVVGLGQLGENVIIQTARLWRDNFGFTGKRLRVTIVDSGALAKTELLHFRYPTLRKVCDVEAQEMDVHSIQFRQAEFLSSTDEEGEMKTVYICLDDDSVGISAGLALLRQIKDRGIHADVAITLTQEAGLGSLFRTSNGDEEGSDGLQVFGLLDQTCTIETLMNGLIESMAQGSHEDYIRKEKEKGETPQTNPSMVTWQKLSEDLKESNRQQADHIVKKVRTIGYEIESMIDWDTPLFEFSPEEVERLAVMEHDRWKREREEAGWLHADGLKDLDKRKSPALVSWGELKKEDQDKDRNTVRAIPRHLARAGFTIVKRQSKMETQ